MPSRNDALKPAQVADNTQFDASDARFVRLAAISWGVCAFFPVGVMYLNLLLMVLALALAPRIGQRIADLRRSAVFWPIVAMLVWTSFVAAVGRWHPDTATRLFHVYRVALVLFLGLILSRSEARAALCGFLGSALLAALAVAVHHVWGLPEWEIWGSLLTPRNNFSSGNMITMATASGIFFLFALADRLQRADRWLALAAALALGVTVAFHGVSRNSQLLVLALFLTAFFWRFRSVRAAIGGTVVVVALAGAFWHFSPTTQSRFAELASDVQLAETDANYSTASGVRLRMWREAAEGMAQHPLVGTGLGSWLPHWRSVWLSLPQHATPAPENETEYRFSEINNPHNDFLLSGMETGVMGLLILVWLLARFVIGAWQEHSVAGGITVLMGVGLFATAMVNAPFRDAALGMTLIWLLSVSAAARKAPTRA